MGKGKNRKSKPGQHAPLQGVGETYNWLVNDVAVINARIAGDTQLTVNIACDVNGFNYTVYDANAGTGTVFPLAAQPIVGQQEVYGNMNDQFTRLSFLWHQYRVNAISMHVVPAGPAGPLQAAANYSLVDEPGKLQRTDARELQTETQLIPEMASQRNFEIHEPYKTMRKNFSLNKWLIQVQSECWKQTQQPNYPTVVRQPYVTNVNTVEEGQVPGLFSCLKFNATPGGPWEGVLCNVLFKTHYVFRERKVLDPLDDIFISKKEDGVHITHLSKLSEDQREQIEDAIGTERQHAEGTKEPLCALPDQPGTSEKVQSSLSQSTIAHLKSLIK